MLAFLEFVAFEWSPPAMVLARVTKGAAHAAVIRDGDRSASATINDPCAWRSVGGGGEVTDGGCSVLVATL